MHCCTAESVFVASAAIRLGAHTDRCCGSHAVYGAISGYGQTLRFLRSLIIPAIPFTFVTLALGTNDDVDVPRCQWVIGFGARKGLNIPPMPFSPILQLPCGGKILTKPRLRAQREEHECEGEIAMKGAGHCVVIRLKGRAGWGRFGKWDRSAEYI
jgi:hypothetical protein